MKSSQSLKSSYSSASLILIIHLLTLNTIFIKQYNCIYIYGLVLHNPIPDDLGLKPNIHDQQKNQQPSLHPNQDESLSFKYVDDNSHHNSNNLKKEELSIDGNNGNTDLLRIRCKQDSDCIDDDGPDNEQMMYCDQHYGYCDYFRQIGELCRYDSQCDSGLICMFGRCEKPFKPGTKGARCNDSNECNPGLCCARQHGERICKTKLKHGQQCFVPLGGLDYSLNELCPCDEGLECRNTKVKNLKKKRKTEFVMRCSYTTIIENNKNSTKTTAYTI